jgi:hypothetical protein
MRGADPGGSWTWCFNGRAMVRETLRRRLGDLRPVRREPGCSSRHHLEAGRSADPAQDCVTAHGFPLGEWFVYVREAQDAGTWFDAQLIEVLPGWRR